MAKTFPEDCLQAIGGPASWWVDEKLKTPCRGGLVWCFVPHVAQTPYTLEVEGRTNATEHTRANLRIVPLRIDQPPKQATLPVAGMPIGGKERFTVYKAKRRPCLVMSTSAPVVEKALTRGKPNANTSPTMLVAPYYGADEDGSRAGYSSAFVERVRHCQYPQFMWDCLPIDGGPEASILRLDHVQPIGCHHESCAVTGFRLSDSAIGIVDHLLDWFMRGTMSADCDVYAYRELMRESFSYT